MEKQAVCGCGVRVHGEGGADRCAPAKRPGQLGRAGQRWASFVPKTRAWRRDPPDATLTESRLASARPSVDGATKKDCDDGMHTALGTASGSCNRALLAPRRPDAPTPSWPGRHDPESAPADEPRAAACFGLHPLARGPEDPGVPGVWKAAESILAACCSHSRSRSRVPAAVRDRCVGAALVQAAIRISWRRKLQTLARLRPVRQPAASSPTPTGTNQG